MADKIVLSAEPRNDVGKGASRRLRRDAGRVPGIVYGGGDEPVRISLIARELAKAEKFEAFFSQILDLQLEGKSVQTILKDVQRHPSRGEIVHLDLQRVRADQELNVHLPLHIKGEEECVGVRLEKGQILHHMIEIEVVCLPAALPEYLEVDVTELSIGDSIHLSEIPLPEGVRIPALELGEDHDQPAVAIVEQRIQEEPEDEEAAEDEAAAEDAEGESEGDGDESGDDAED
jgi:large subunit ribosomal protein L25